MLRSESRQQVLDKHLNILTSLCFSCEKPGLQRKVKFVATLSELPLFRSDYGVICFQAGHQLQCCWCAAKPQGRLRAGAGALFQRGCGMEEAGEGKVRDGRAQDEAREEGQKQNAMEKRAKPIDRIDSNISLLSF